MDGSRTALAQQPRREEQLQKLVIGACERTHHRGVAPGNGRMEANIALAIRETAQRKLPDRTSDALGDGVGHALVPGHRRSEEHTSELQSLMRISYAVFCLKKKKTQLIISCIRITTKS